MAKGRSPNCPQITFAEAIEKGRKVYTKEHTHPSARLVVAGDLGYSGMNGRSLTQIGALRQYGILEGSGDALRISADAIAYFELDDGAEKEEAARRMIFSPPLFAELRKDFKGALPSEANLKHTLIKKGFLPKAAEDVIEVYKANVALVGGEESEYIEGQNDQEETPIVNPAVVPPIRPPAPPVAGLQTYAFALSPDARAELSLRGTITPDDLELLRQHIDLTIRGLSKLEERTRKQKDRIAVEAQSLCPGCKVQFEDHGNFIWFKVTKDGVDLIPYSGDYPVSFYEGLSDQTFRERLQHLGGGRIK